MHELGDERPNIIVFNRYTFWEALAKELFSCQELHSGVRHLHALEV
jgi:hypothetical protein